MQEQIALESAKTFSKRDKDQVEPPQRDQEGSLSLLIEGRSAMKRLVAQWTPQIQHHRIISLEGPLGAGKTHFVKAYVELLGRENEVTSPTFSLLQNYSVTDGSHEQMIYHWDWYRLDSEAEVLQLGVQDYFLEGIHFIEWGNKFPQLLPPEALRISIEIPEQLCPLNEDHLGSEGAITDALRKVTLGPLLTISA